MPLHSAGILLYRQTGPIPEVLLIHPGGPFWAKKDAGAWSIPKGLIGKDEHPLTAARREFVEETGGMVGGREILLGDFRQPGGKIITVYAVAGDFDLAAFRSNTFEMEWPPKSGVTAAFPEADRAGWFPLPAARLRLVKGQLPVLDALAALLAAKQHPV